jgi:manganese/iron transport system substrate-binding protein
MIYRLINNPYLSIFTLITFALYLNACQASSPSLPDEIEPFKVVASTNIIGDVLQEIGGEAIELTVLLSPGADPHIFEPTPRDIVAISDADVVFINGLGLEEFLDRYLDDNLAAERLVSVSQGVQPRKFLEPHTHPDHEDDHGHEDEHGHEDDHGPEDGHAHDDDHDHGEYDPHVWFDVQNVIFWTYTIEQKLSELDPDNANLYADNANLYRQRLEELDAWIVEQVSRIPQENRKLVSDHESFGYFANRYGFQQLATVIPNVSTAAAPSAQDLARLSDIIEETGVKAIFVGTTVNPDLSRRIAEDTGIRLGMLYTGSLSEPGGPANSYIDMMRYNVNLIVSALK